MCVCVCDFGKDFTMLLSFLYIVVLTFFSLRSFGIVLFCYEVQGSV